MAALTPPAGSVPVGVAVSTPGPAVADVTETSAIPSDREELGCPVALSVFGDTLPSEVDMVTASTASGWVKRPDASSNCTRAEIDPPTSSEVSLDETVSETGVPVVAKEYVTRSMRTPLLENTSRAPE